MFAAVTGFLTLAIFVCEARGLPKPVGEINGVWTMEVPFGENVVLTCKSNDNDHNFLYWNVVNKNLVIGPANDYDQSKFRFAILSGNLTIKSVTNDDAGIYSCVSKGVTSDDINIFKTKVVVQKDWEEVYEHDPSVNVFRVIIIIATLIIIAGGAYLVYKIWKDRYKYPSYLEEVDEDEDEDSAEEIFRTPGTSGTSTSSKSTGNIIMDKHLDSPHISTDFSSILDTANSK